MSRTTVCLCSLVLALSFNGALRADDSDIFLTATPDMPNVLILIDTSGSMDDRINSVPKIDIAKQVVTDMLNNIGGVRFGLMSFNDDSDGAHMMAPIGSSTASMITAVAGLNADGWTPLGRSAQDIDDYFKGLYTETVNTGGGTGQGGGDRRDYDRGGGTSSGSGNSTCYRCRSTTTNYSSPIQSGCQKNYLIIVTDGMPTGEAETLLPQVVTTLYTTDHSTTYAGMQNVITYTVGFNVPEGTPLLTQTAANGGGTFYAADDAAELAAALLDALQGIVAEGYMFAAPLIPSTSATGGTKAYLASFETSGRPFWKGHLKAYQRDSSGNVPVDTDGKPLDSAMVWDAGTQLAAKASSTRTVYTVISGSLQSFATTNANLTTTLLGTTSSTTRGKIINFIRGIDAYDEDGDTNTTEEREWKLGDIFHSNPILVFPPPSSSTDSTYVAFKTANASRTTIVLVGANDGMLHAFRASDGEELWAFVPPNVLNKLASLTSNSSGAHPYYVDATPVIMDLKISGTWKTVALFGERRGGNAYYMLDITNTSTPAYLWSFTDSELAETWSEPTIGKIVMADTTQKDVAFFGGGYNTANNNASGRAFFVLDLAAGTKLWQYKTGSTADTSYMKFSLPGSPTPIDLNGDGLTDRVYAADVGGQIWKFDVSPAATLSSGLVSNWTGKRLFVSNTSQTVPPASGEFHASRAMYGAPELSYDATGALWVFIGTGDRNHPNDTSSNRFYAIKDTTNMTNGSALNESSLVDSTAGTAVTQGWYLLLASNEKVLGSATAFNNVVFFSTYISYATAPCDTPNGSARLYGVMASNGRAGVDWVTHQYLTSSTTTTARGKDLGGGIPSEPGIAAGTNGGDSVVVGTSDQQLVTDTFPRLARRVLRYWREVFN